MLTTRAVGKQQPPSQHFTFTPYTGTGLAGDRDAASMGRLDASWRRPRGAGNSCQYTERADRGVGETDFIQVEADLPRCVGPIQ